MLLKKGRTLREKLNSQVTVRYSNYKTILNCQYPVPILLYSTAEKWL